MSGASEQDLTAQFQPEIERALAQVIDPEIGKPITELNMVESVFVDASAKARIKLLMTIEGCPMRSKLEQSAAEAVAKVAGLSEVRIDSGTMSAQQREALVEYLRSSRRAIAFNQPGSLTEVIAISSGKGGVGKSTLTANLAVALQRLGKRVGVIDADIHGFSMPGMFGVNDQPTKVNDLLMPPQAFGVKVMSIGMFVPPGQAVVWRGPKIHRAIEQFAADVFWGDLDFLLLDLPPGTGDVAISIAQLLPNAKLLVVTTPNLAASQVAVRIGSLAKSTQQEVLGVVENMSFLRLPSGEKMELFGTGGGQQVADEISSVLGVRVPLLAQIPLEEAVRIGADAGQPQVARETLANTRLAQPGSSENEPQPVNADQSAASAAFMQLAAKLVKPRGLSGKKLPLSVV